MSNSTTIKFEKGTTQKAREKTDSWIKEHLPDHYSLITTGLPEYDDRLDSWRVSLNAKNSKLNLVGEVRLDRHVKKITDSTNLQLIIDRVNKHKKTKSRNQKVSDKSKLIYPAPVGNKIILGNSINVLADFPPDTAQLVFTSPPYYNAKPAYSEYVDYKEYLKFLERIFARCHAVLSEGRFLVVNISPVLIKRTSRNTASTRVPIPFDLHGILDKIGFDFIDDIHWVKPEGAGWNIGRGRRFAADRQPLQYKPVVVTEYILVYRKKTSRLIDWNIRNHYDQSLVKASKIGDDYDKTNLWKIHPSFNKEHPATFPEELAEKVIRYYSFKGDLVLDPFGGSGTVGKAAIGMNRRFLLIDSEKKYFELMKKSLTPLIPENTTVDFSVY
ncbi:MAG: site-specific DNA-methyltransferase [Puia sp.]|nr:site-specific DNA-methyltransferase [Puia sp.]